MQSVGLGNVNGVTLGYQYGTGQGEAKATKDGSTYTISGTATGIDMANPMQPVNKPFEIDCHLPVAGYSKFDAAAASRKGRRRCRETRAPSQEGKV